MAKERVSITHGGETIETDMETIRAMGAGINLSGLRSEIQELEQAFLRKQEASTQFKDAIAVVAIQNGIIEGVLSQYIAARCNDTVKKKAQSAEQLNLLFAEISA